MTVERYLCCCFPHVPPRDGTLVNLLCIGGIVVFSILFNITRFFEYHTVPSSTIEPTELAETLKEVPFDFLKPTVEESIQSMIEESNGYHVESTDLRSSDKYIR